MRLRKVKPGLTEKGIDRFVDQIFIEELDALLGFKGNTLYCCKLLTQKLFNEK